MPDQYGTPLWPRFLLVIAFLFYIFTSPDGGPPPGLLNSADYAAERLSKSRHSFSVLNNTNFSDFAPSAGKYLNLTGFKEKDNFAWDRLDAFKERSLEAIRDARGRWREGKGEEAALTGQVYDNVTGVVTGEWVRVLEDGETKGRKLNLTEIVPYQEWATDVWTRNITGREGRMQLRLKEKRDHELDLAEKLPFDPKLGLDKFSGGLVRELTAVLTVQDEGSRGDGWDMSLHGLHWPRQGTILLTTTSEKFPGIYGLPHFALSLDYFTTSQEILKKAMAKALEKMEKANLADPNSTDQSIEDEATMPTPHCEYVVYAQVHPLDMSRIEGSEKDGQASLRLVSQIEKELRFPTGAPAVGVPALRISTVVFSPDCGFVLESKGPPSYASAEGKHLVGVKHEVFLYSVHTWVVAFSLVVSCQLALLRMQSKDSSTPSALARVSSHTIFMMAFVDVLMFSASSILSTTAPDIFPSAHVAAFVCLLSFCLSGRFYAAIHAVQEPERRAREHAQAQAGQAAEVVQQPGTVVAASVNESSILPAPGTATRTNQDDAPIIVPSDQDVDAEIDQVANAASAIPRPPPRPAPVQATRPRLLGELKFSRVVLVFFYMFILLLTASATNWPVALRTAYTHLLALIYLSFWLPQIHRNALHNCHKALLWKFVFGQSFLRLLPFAYFYLKPDNVWFARPGWHSFYVYVAWVWIQILVLLAQATLGPRWILPAGWASDGWDYHALISSTNLEAGGMPIGLVQNASETSAEADEGKWTVDCAICKEVLEMPVMEEGEASSGGIAGRLARRMYMVTPCRHAFHAACLEGWMRHRLQCPVCRDDLPPL